MFFWVNQNKTYAEESNGGYLWAPILDKGGMRKFHWETMNDLKPDDIVINYAQSKIIGFCKVKSLAYDCDQPGELESVNLWAKKGRMVDAEYFTFRIQNKLTAIFNQIKHLQNAVYSPINETQKANQGYLYQIKDEMAYRIFELAGYDPKSITSRKLSIEDKQIADSEIITSRIGLVTNRVGQAEFRRKLLIRWQNKCAVTGFSNAEILIASHIVPWRDATDAERLDVDNGIILSPVYDALFDKNFISFNDDGSIILSKILLKLDMDKINITGNEKIKKLSEGNLKYLKRHRDLLK